MSREATETVRFDRWLWAARFYKTRTLATAEVVGGKARLNDQRVKPAAPVRTGDTVRVLKPPYEWVVEVRGVSERRGPASEARALYAETEASREKRARRRIQMREVPVPTYEGKGRPTKKERREIDRMRRGLRDDR